MDSIFKQSIYGKILELSDVDMQRKLWLNEHNDTGLISSYVELMCTLFDDNGFDHFVDKGAGLAGLSSKAIHELHVLRYLLDNYNGEKYTQEEILEDPEWRNIVHQAQVVLRYWDNN